MFKLSLPVITVIAAIATTSADPAVADGRVALVVDNDAHQSLSPLANPGADAGELARVLSSSGFEVLSCDGERPGSFDLTREGLQEHGKPQFEAASTSLPANSPAAST